MFVPPAGFQSMLPDRSSKIRASGELELVKSADSSVGGAVANALPAKKLAARRINRLRQVVLIIFFIKSSLIDTWLIFLLDRIRQQSGFLL